MAALMQDFRLRTCTPSTACQQGHECSACDLMDLLCVTWVLFSDVSFSMRLELLERTKESGCLKGRKSRSLHTNDIPASAQPNTYHTATLLAGLCCATATAKVQSLIFPTEIAWDQK